MKNHCLSLLKNLELASSYHDRSKVLTAFLHAVLLLLGKEADVGVCFRDSEGNLEIRGVLNSFIANSDADAWRNCIERARTTGEISFETLSGHHCGALLLHASELSSDQMIFLYDTKEQASSEYADEITSLAHIFGNQIKLLDYSELDSLTHLLNRKTFESTFYRLLTPPSPEDEDEYAFHDRRRLQKEQPPAWLCVIDIDFFKRINDEYGHLFGDEVLLRMGNLMRNTFRDGDRLFRFGGEEFVVILYAATEALAEAGFNRFRQCVENHEFPQVGKVTCSIGFTSISETDVATDVVGRADEALYFAKQNGRNQVAHYQTLVEQGLIAKPTHAEVSELADLDIDALFDTASL